VSLARRTRLALTAQQRNAIREGRDQAVRAGWDPATRSAVAALTDIQLLGALDFEAWRPAREIAIRLGVRAHEVSRLGRRLRALPGVEVRTHQRGHEGSARYRRRPLAAEMIPPAGRGFSTMINRVDPASGTQSRH
jgi:hypothetical protein